MQVDIYTFLKEGRFLNFDGKTKEAGIVKEVGMPEEIEDYGRKGKYLHYHNLRFSLFEDSLVSIDLFFMGYSAEYTLTVEDDNVVICSDTPLIKIIDSLNKLGLKWSIPYESARLDYLLVEVASGVKIYFFLENGQINRISRSW